MAVSAAEYYEVRWRPKDSEQSWSAPQRISPNDEIVVKGLDRTQQYEFEVRAVSNCGAKSIWVSSDYTVPSPPPLPAVNIPVGSGMPDGIQLNWGDGTAPRGDIQYEISRAPATGSYTATPPPVGDASWARVAIVSGTTWVDAVTDTANYWYRIRTVDFNGNTGVWAVIAGPVAASISTPELALDVAQARADIAAVGDQADQIRTDVDSTIAQVQTLQGQVGDILKADTWVNTKTYPDGDLVQLGGKLYRSLQDANIGHQPTGATDAWWEYIGNYASLGEAVGAVAANVAVNNNKITQAQNDITAQSESISENAAAIAGKADASALSTTNATVAAQGAAITASAADIALLGAHNAGKTAFNLNSATVKIDGGQTLAQTLTGLQAADNALDSRVDSEQQARIDGDTANASSITAVQASINNVGPNLYPSPSGEEGLAGWQASPNGAIAVTDDGTGTRFRITTTTGVTRVVGPMVPIYGGGGAYTAAATFNRSVDPANFRFSIYFYDAEGVFLGTTPYAQIPSNVSWKRFSTTGVPPAGSTQCRINMQREDGGVAGNIYFNMVKLEYGSTPTAFTNDASVRGLASVTQSITANVGPGGAYAQATTMLDVNGHITGVSQTNNGTTGDFIIIADKFGIVAPEGGARTEYSSGNWRVYDTAGTLRVQIGVWS